MSTTLMLATEAKQLTKDKQSAFEEQVLESKAWKRLIAQIIESALAGESCTDFYLSESDDRKILIVFRKYLEEAGYKVFNAFGNRISISWS